MTSEDFEWHKRLRGYTKTSKWLQRLQKCRKKYKKVYQISKMKIQILKMKICKFQKNPIDSMWILSPNIYKKNNLTIHLKKRCKTLKKIEETNYKKLYEMQKEKISQYEDERDLYKQIGKLSNGRY